MASGSTRFEFRLWWSSHDPQGRCDAQLYVVGTRYEAARLWESACNFRWLPHGHTRATVSQVQLWRSDSHGPWFSYGVMDDTRDVWHLWPEPDEAQVEAVKQLFGQHDKKGQLV